MKKLILLLIILSIILVGCLPEDQEFEQIDTMTLLHNSPSLFLAKFYDDGAVCYIFVRSRGGGIDCLEIKNDQ